MPVSPEGTVLGNFPIISVKKKMRHEIERIYRKQKIEIYNKPGSNEDNYWLFYLGDELEHMPELKDIPEGSLVHVEEHILM